MGIGRPSEFRQEIADQICEKLADGLSLRSICEADEMPAKSTVFKWLNDFKSFSDQYARARVSQAEHWAEEIVEISDDSQGDTYTDEEGQERTNHEVVARARLRVDTRKWLMARMAPKKYGDKLDIDQRTTHEVGGSVADLMRAIDGRTRSK